MISKTKSVMLSVVTSVEFGTLVEHRSINRKMGFQMSMLQLLLGGRQ